MRGGAQRPAADVVDALRAWWETTDPPRFAWAHLYDAHFPYRAPPGPWHDAVEGRPYDAEIAYMDHQLGRLLDTVGPSTLVEVVSGKT